ncbi:hypothetical protein K2173_015628 [Erythroxylum novogranatense]|uniref:Large ribosomal subunit protein uL2 C-terminal domain-containing protein n=1 Tax=Erythroxylum novogranatense TaxID=1862640 RepID=A0AAV8SEP8_9ROSI|nr:hypothetical protein K2173_015628 [Erythroxylum novogranatense]
MVTIIENSDGKLTPTCVQIRWKVYIDYRKLNLVNRKDIFCFHLLIKCLKDLQVNLTIVLIDQKEESTSTDIPLGTTIHNIEITLGKGGQLARAAGVVAKLIAKEEKSATLKLPSGVVLGNSGVNQKGLGRAGSKCWLGKRPVVRGVEAPIGEKPATPWGYPALGRRSRKRNKYSDNLILHCRSK